MLHCVSCGKAVSEANANFCSGCGATLVAPSLPTPSHTHEAESRPRQSTSRPSLTHRPNEGHAATSRPGSAESRSSWPLGVSFSEFRKRKETERRENFIPKGKKKAPLPKETNVTINIGMMMAHILMIMKMMVMIYC